MNQSHAHQTVLLNETVSALVIDPKGYYVDGTFGRGGHSRALLNALSAEGRLLAIDKDPQAISYAHANLGSDERFSCVQGSFADILSIVRAKGWEGKVSGVLLDLGLSSPQIDNAERGFSFMQEGPLDMRMNPDQGESAAQWLSHASVDEMTHVFKTYGEERFAKRIAHAIVEKRSVEPIKTTQQLVEIVAAAQPVKEKHKHPATRCFQAIRIFINNELQDLELFLESVLELLAPQGRFAVISFHSLEDRMVKQKMQVLEHGEPLPRHLPIRHDESRQKVRVIAKKIRASEDEVQANPRARSAILRVAEKC